MNADTERLMQAVADVALLAGDVALKSYRTRLAIETKRDGSPVTVADRAAEQSAREWIGARFPEDGIMGEEFGLTRPDARRRWLVDPIDGTRTYVRGVPLWGTLVAVVDQNEVLAGAACFPALHEIIVASPGGGCWWNGITCSVSRVAEVAKATVVTTDERFAMSPERRQGWNRLTTRAELSRSWGDCYGYLLVATARAEVMADPVLSPWDAAAVMVVVEEAGGVFTDWSGARTPFGGSAIATNRALAEEVRELLADPVDRSGDA
jgi:histidinol phosphatase-like enzyme (inositol monophosphatase family)